MSAAVTQVVTVSPDRVPPVVNSVVLQPNVIQVAYFDAGGLNAATVCDPANYQLLASGGDGTFGDENEIDLGSSIGMITFNAASGLATLP